MCSQLHTLEKKLSKYASREVTPEFSWRGESHGITLVTTVKDYFLLFLENMLEAVNHCGINSACTLPPCFESAVQQTGVHF